MATTKSRLNLPEPMGIKPLEIDATSIYLRWAILSSHGLSPEELKDLQFEFRTTDNKLLADCIDNAAAHEYKARLCGLSENTKYRFQVRSKLKLKDEIITSVWSNRIEISTQPKMNHFFIISNEKELSIESLKHRLKVYMNENKKLQLQIQQLQLQLNRAPKDAKPGHWQWDYRKIVNWIMRIEDGTFKQYKKTLSKALKEDGVTGKDLVQVNESNLKDWGISNFNQRKVLIHYIKTLTENDKPPIIEYDESIAIECDTNTVTKEKEKEKEEEAKEEEKEEEVKKEEEEKKEEFAISESLEELLALDSDINSEKKKVWKYKEGMLSVLVVSATNVDNMDVDKWGIGGKGASTNASDPYIELDLKGNYKKERTKSIQNCDNPIWNEKFQLFVNDPKNDCLKCGLYDHDKWTMDDKIGVVEIPIITILSSNGFLRKEFDVIGSKNGCKLELELKYWESMR